MDVMTNRPPVAVIGSEIVANLPLTVKFNAGGSTDPENDIILGFIWDFGDGSPVDESYSPSHTYSKSGDYTVTLKVMDYREMYSAMVSKKITIANVTALNQPESELVSLSPNPVNSGIVTIKIDTDIDKKIAIDIFDLSGKKVLSIQETLLSGSVNLNVSTLAKGTYILSLKGINVTRNLRMVVR